jgi:hypothetical protein
MFPSEQKAFFVLMRVCHGYYGGAADTMHHILTSHNPLSHFSFFSISFFLSSDRWVAALEYSIDRWMKA